MKVWIIVMILWALIMTIYALLSTISLGEELEKAEKKLQYRENVINNQSEEMANLRRKIADLRTINNDPHTRIVGFCSECSEGKWSESLGCYLCGIEEKGEHDYCSDHKPRYDNG